MALTTRQLSNAGAPLSSPTGVVLAGVSISFTLVDGSGAVTDAFDVLTGERVVSTVSTVTDANGIFSINLWPNDRGDKTTKYVCKILRASQEFASQVPSGAGVLSWLNFRTNGVILTPAQVTALDAHIADSNMHLTKAQNVLLDGLDPLLTPSDLNYVKGVTSPVQTQFNKLSSPLAPYIGVFGLSAYGFCVYNF